MTSVLFAIQKGNEGKGAEARKRRESPWVFPSPRADLGHMVSTNKAWGRTMIEVRAAIVQCWQGARQISGTGSCGRFRLICSGFPEIIEASTEFRAAQGDDGVCAPYGPVHAGRCRPRLYSPPPRRRWRCIISAGETFGIAFGADCSRCIQRNPAPLCIFSRSGVARTPVPAASTTISWP
jgi:hypothetical protein